MRLETQTGGTAGIEEIAGANGDDVEEARQAMIEAKLDAKEAEIMNDGRN